MQKKTGSRKGKENDVWNLHENVTESDLIELFGLRITNYAIDNWSMMAHRCQSTKTKKKKRIKITNKTKKKKKNEKMKKNIIQKNTPQNYHGPSLPNLILSYQALYITKNGFFWIASKNFFSWNSGIDRETGGD